MDNVLETIIRLSSYPFHQCLIDKHKLMWFTLNYNKNRCRNKIKHR